MYVTLAQRDDCNGHVLRKKSRNQEQRKKENKALAIFGCPASPWGLEGLVLDSICSRDIGEEDAEDALQSATQARQYEIPGKRKRNMNKGEEK